MMSDAEVCGSIAHDHNDQSVIFRCTLPKDHAGDHAERNAGGSRGWLRRPDETPQPGLVVQEPVVPWLTFRLTPAMYSFLCGELEWACHVCGRNDMGGHDPNIALILYKDLMKQGGVTIISDPPPLRPAPKTKVDPVTKALSEKTVPSGFGLVRGLSDRAAKFWNK